MAKMMIGNMAKTFALSLLLSLFAVGMAGCATGPQQEAGEEGEVKKEAVGEEGEAANEEEREETNEEEEKEKKGGEKDD